MSSSEKRKKTVNKQVRMTPPEAKYIAERAWAFGVSVPEYMRECAMNRPLPDKVDMQLIALLKKLNADLGRLGGIQKKWLTGDWMTAAGYNHDIGRLLEEIRNTQAMIPAAIDSVIASIR